MKILVFAHQMEIGGTQANAIALATTLRDAHQWDVVLFATPGPMVPVAEEHGLRVLPAPVPRVYPSPARMGALREAVRQERPDVIQAWDWWQCLDAYYGVHLPMRVPLVVTDQMMTLTRLLPKRLPTTFGTPELVDRARAAGRRPVELIPPPIDVRENAPGAADPLPFRLRHGLDDGQLTLITVSRLSRFLKGESLVRTVEAVRAIGRGLPLRLVIVGEGVMREPLERLAAEVNAELGRKAVVLAGPLLDPRPAYAAADIVVGMGASALRGMAFGKPVLVVGERGFSAPFTPETADEFCYKGIYGLGDGHEDNSRLVANIREMARRADEFKALGEFSRRFVVENFSLDVVCARLATFCGEAVAHVPPLRVSALDALRTAAVCLRERAFVRDDHFLRRRLAPWRRKA